MPDIPVDLTQCAGGNCAKVAANGKSTGGGPRAPTTARGRRFKRPEDVERL
jgi:hypothetical protein